MFDLGVRCSSGFGALFPIVVAAVYWKRATRAGIYAAIGATVVTWSILFYQDILATKPEGADEELLVLGMMPVVFIFLASAVALVGVSLCTEPPSEATIDKFFDPAAKRA